MQHMVCIGTFFRFFDAAAAGSGASSSSSDSCKAKEIHLLAAKARQGMTSGMAGTSDRQHDGPTRLSCAGWGHARTSSSSSSLALASGISSSSSSEDSSSDSSSSSALAAALALAAAAGAGAASSSSSLSSSEDSSSAVAAGLVACSQCEYAQTRPFKPELHECVPGDAVWGSPVSPADMLMPEEEAYKVEHEG